MNVKFFANVHVFNTFLKEDSIIKTYTGIGILDLLDFWIFRLVGFVGFVGFVGLLDFWI